MCREQLASAGFGPWLDRFDALVAYADWARWAPEAYARGERIGFPVRSGEEIDLRVDFDGWKYPVDGFYPLEEHGRWLKGADGEIYLIPMFDAPNGVMLSMVIPWVFAPNDEPAIIDVLIDGERVASTPFCLGARNGTPSRFYWMIERPVRYGRSLRLGLRARNARNPKALG